MTILLAVCALLTALLSAYALGHYLCALVFLVGRKRTREFSPRSREAIAVLIPAKNEAERALRAITSLAEQDHAGPVEIYLLLKDTSDTSVPFLREIYPQADFSRGPIVELVRTAERKVVVAFTGADKKSDKINWIVPRIETKYLGILDADHQADKNWVSTSLVLLEEKKARIIQGRRSPLSALGFFPLWDSLHQHIGCELFNIAFSRLNLSVFFTGTTAVMETSLLAANPLTDCITEDLDFSYTIVLKGVRIIDNPYSGSCEETSPNLYSFLARRRRWSNGHTSSFLQHIWLLRGAPLSLAERFQFLYHGSHYLISVVVFVLHLAIGVFFITALSLSSQGAAVFASLLLAWRIAGSQRTVDRVARVAEISVVFGWIFPAVVIAMNLLQAVLINDIGRANLPIPYALQAVGLIGLCAPLIILLVGLAGFRQLSAQTFAAVVLTYPIAFYMDLCGVLLGMADYVTGRARWRPVARTVPALAVRTSSAPKLLPTLHIKESWKLSALVTLSGSMLKLRVRSMLKPSRIILAVSVLAIFAVGVLYEPGSRIGVAQGRCEALEHDGEPWIVPAKKLEGYCGTPGPEPEQAMRTGTFKLQREDNLAPLDPTYWDRLDTTFFCNLATFSPENAVVKDGEGIKLKLEEKTTGDKSFTSGSIATKDAQHLYGRFETVLKPAKTSGVITAFFLYRFDPWQEIDAEFLGRDTSKLLVNVYYNPGEIGDLYNYGMRGTPVLIDLGFDASLDFHKYTIEWEQDEIRWFVDDKLVHVRHAGRPTPIPHLPMRLHVNLWPCCSEQLVGPFSAANAPAQAEIKSVAISNWYPSPLPHFLERFDSLFSSDETSGWRKKAKWIQ
jgi:beta-glucanase (GH16 family)/cellulose synthase/poly-beta-1,6-N-acetylglucosamine synthase-like glycosyltransferase